VTNEKFEEFVAPPAATRRRARADPGGVPDRAAGEPGGWPIVFMPTPGPVRLTDHYWWRYEKAPTGGTR
jgi:hypothetical protein